MKKLFLLLLTIFLSGATYSQIYTRKGYETSGTPIYNFDGKYIRQGYETSGTPINNYDGQYIRSGYETSGTPIFNTSGKLPNAILILMSQ